MSYTSLIQSVLDQSLRSEDPPTTSYSFRGCCSLKKKTPSMAPGEKKRKQRLLAELEKEGTPEARKMRQQLVEELASVS